MAKILFNRAPFLGTEFKYIQDAIESAHISGDGKYTKLCNELLEQRTGTAKSLLVHSGTAALEMSALLLNIKPGDEVICPSYTFVSTANAFVLRGAKIVFVDIRDDTLNLDERKLAAAITPKTRAIVPVHYAGVGCEMDEIMDIAHRNHRYVVEDAAQAVGSKYKGRPLGALADLGCYSFHETKNISSGEGGAILVNRPDMVEDAEIIREKGTNRSRFFRGQVDKYTWVDVGSSYLPGDMNAAYLYPQLMKMDEINANRMRTWEKYDANFKQFDSVKTPFIPKYCQHNAHMYYLRFRDLDTRTNFIKYMAENDIMCVFHYVPLHSSPAGRKFGRVAGDMSVTNKIGDTLVRLPMYYNMRAEDQNRVITVANKFLEKTR